MRLFSDENIGMTKSGFWYNNETVARPIFFEISKISKMTNQIWSELDKLILRYDFERFIEHSFEKNTKEKKVVPHCRNAVDDPTLHKYLHDSVNNWNFHKTFILNESYGLRL